MKYIEYLNQVVTIKKLVIDDSYKTYKNYKKRASIYIMHSSAVVNGANGYFYVGVTTKTLSKRLEQHLYEAKQYIDGSKVGTVKLKWLASMIKNNVEIHITLLNSVPDIGSTRYIVEDIWIQYLKSKNIPLVNGNNKIYFK